MEAAKILTPVKVISGIVLTLGIISFLIGFFGSGYSTLTSVGIGTITGAVFIFLIGVFFVATEEMLKKIE